MSQSFLKVKCVCVFFCATSDGRQISMPQPQLWQGLNITSVQEKPLVCFSARLIISKYTHKWQSFLSYLFSRAQLSHFQACVRFWQDLTASSWSWSLLQFWTADGSSLPWYYDVRQPGLGSFWREITPNLASSLVPTQRRSYKGIHEHKQAVVIQNRSLH